MRFHLYDAATALIVLISSSLPYYFATLDRFFQPSYVPSEEDITQSYSRTIGISETTLCGRNMLVVDVGGQRNERKKWILCFHYVTSIVCVASLGGYDQCLIEDKDAVCRHMGSPTSPCFVD